MQETAGWRAGCLPKIARTCLPCVPQGGRAGPRLLYHAHLARPTENETKWPQRGQLVTKARTRGVGGRQSVACIAIRSVRFLAGSRSARGVFVEDASNDSSSPT